MLSATVENQGLKATDAVISARSAPVARLPILPCGAPHFLLFGNGGPAGLWVGKPIGDGAGLENRVSVTALGVRLPPYPSEGQANWRWQRLAKASSASLVSSILTPSVGRVAGIKSFPLRHR